MMQALKLILIALIAIGDVAAVVCLIYAMAQHYQTLMLVLIAIVQLVCISVLLMLVASYRERAKQELPAHSYR